ncbi:hypothetical protein [Lactiplantibacillus plantarum]|uniref:hypothetical protein n=1 Tax=Lactiplantibacillus plantarum TaxID=1590 RepID=UPI003F52DC97
MNNINITNVSMQADGVFKINFMATYEGSSHIEGFIYMSSSDYQAKTGAQQEEVIVNTITDNLAGKITAVENPVTNDSNKL